MKKFSIKKQIRIQRLQDKNRMVGSTFNPSGVTSESISIRNNDIRSKFQKMTLEQRQNYWEQLKPVIDNWEYSWMPEWCVFKMNFVSCFGDVI